MKAQAYYRCKNCGRIAASDAGKRISCCPDCGSGSLQILVPVDSEAEADPLSRRAKGSLAALIGFVGIACVAVFVLFGRMLQGYMTFEGRREAAEKAHEQLSTEIQAQEASLSSLKQRAAEELARTSGSARQAEISANAAKAALAEAENALHRPRLTLSNETARVTGRRTELADLENDRSRLRQKVDMLAAEEARLSSAVEAATSRTNRLAFDVAFAEKSQASASADLVKAQAALHTANAARDKAQEQVDTQIARVTVLAARKEALEADIRDLEKTQVALDATITELKKQKAVALGEATKASAALDAVIAARDKAREEADAQSARAARLKADILALENAKAGAEKVKGEVGE